MTTVTRTREIADNVPVTNRYRVSYQPAGSRTWDECRALTPAAARALLDTLAAMRVTDLNVLLDEPATQHAQDEADQSYADVTQALRLGIL